MLTKPTAAVNLAGSDQPPTSRASSEQTAAREPVPLTRSGPRRWSVTIPYVPPTIVEAVDAADAWEKFKARWGILKSEHVPAISEVLDAAGSGADKKE
jgi:hypothetical protein